MTKQMRLLSLVPILVAGAIASAAHAQAPPRSKAETIRSWSAPEATQGVAVDRAHFYAVANSRIAKYDKKSGRKLAEWVGEPARFPHLNSCAVIGKELVCANSNYPKTPMTSSVEFFDPFRMTHLRTVSLGQQIGSLTWVDWKDGAWWAVFANYEEKGGEPGRGSANTQLVKFDEQWRRTEAWSFPPAIVERFKPSSSSGGGWGRDGRLYVTGHDHTELYVLALPKGGSTLDHLATVDVEIEGQAIAFDHGQERVLFGISRPKRQVVMMRLP